MPEIKLKPCPFCGGEAELKAVGDYNSLYVYACKLCKKTPVLKYEARNTAKNAAKTWNRRVDKWLNTKTLNR